jgi:hypothetical protein
MATTLTKEEKTIIIDQHLKSLDFSIYGLELELIQYEAGSTVDPEGLERINNNLSTLNAKRDALNAEKSSLVEQE